jgi:hypothetical protein
MRLKTEASTIPRSFYGVSGSASQMEDIAFPVAVFDPDDIEFVCGSW